MGSERANLVVVKVGDCDRETSRATARRAHFAEKSRDIVVLPRRSCSSRFLKAKDDRLTLADRLSARFGYFVLEDGWSSAEPEDED